ncbi:nuclear transport factor 2 family protein [Kribbella qitaiheensis]|uniref:nuclear transport factor 2 family protein n=1 Tax=Kribbella qitaiheensis TaxID=1544730 RepID=UPI0016263DDF|nr:nuclear transport factor 2 family protein [Kribbella qitaiheensis]
MTIENLTTDNKTIIQQALADLLTSGSTEGLEPLLSKDFVHHRPDRTSTRSEWLTSIQAALVPLADQQVEVLHLLADEDHVVVHTRRRLPDGGPEIVVVDILRFAAGLVVEAWETIEPMAEAASHLTWWQLVR